MGPPPPPGGLPAKRGDDTGMSSEDDGLPRSPPEMSLHDIGPGTTIKASDSLHHLTALSVPTVEGSWGLWWPLLRFPWEGVAVVHAARPCSRLRQWGLIISPWAGFFFFFFFILWAEIPVLSGDTILVTFFIMVIGLTQSTLYLVFPVWADDQTGHPISKKEKHFCYLFSVVMTFGWREKGVVNIHDLI